MAASEPPAHDGSGSGSGSGAGSGVGAWAWALGRRGSGPSSSSWSRRTAGGRPGVRRPRAGGRAAGRRGGVVRVQRLSRPERAPRRGGGGARGAGPLGGWLGRIQAGHRLAPHPQHPGACARGVEGDRGRRHLPDRVRRQPRRAVRARRTGRRCALGRAEPRQHHRWLPALPLAARRVPPSRHGPSRRAALGPVRIRLRHADDRGQRLGLLHGRGRGPGRRAARPVRPPRGAARPR